MQIRKEQIDTVEEEDVIYGNYNNVSTISSGGLVMPSYSFSTLQLNNNFKYRGTIKGVLKSPITNGTQPYLRFRLGATSADYVLDLSTPGTSGAPGDSYHDVFIQFELDLIGGSLISYKYIVTGHMVSSIQGSTTNKIYFEPMSPTYAQHTNVNANKTFSVTFIGNTGNTFTRYHYLLEQCSLYDIKEWRV